MVTATIHLTGNRTFALTIPAEFANSVNHWGANEYAVGYSMHHGGTSIFNCTSPAEAAGWRAGFRDELRRQGAYAPEVAETFAVAA